jgi:hypothetical protein
LDIYPLGKVPEIVFSRKVSVFPNPTSDLVFIEFDVIEANKTIVDVYNMLGRKIETIKDEFFTSRREKG